MLAVSCGYGVISLRISGPPTGPTISASLLIFFALPFPCCLRIASSSSLVQVTQSNRNFAECLQLIRSMAPLQSIRLVRDHPDISLYISKARVLTVGAWENCRCLSLPTSRRNATQTFGILTPLELMLKSLMRTFLLVALHYRQVDSLPPRSCKCIRDQQ